MNAAGNEFLAGSSFAGYEHGFSVAGYAVHHAHESMHQGTGEDENSTINLTRNSMCRLGFLSS